MQELCSCTLLVDVERSAAILEREEGDVVIRLQFVFCWFSNQQEKVLMEVMERSRATKKRGCLTWR